MRRLVMILIAAGMMVGGVAAVSTGNAAELFNTVKKKDAQAQGIPKKAESGSRGDGKATLFNNKSKTQALRSSGLNSNRKSAGIAIGSNSLPEDAVSAYMYLNAQMNAYMGKASVSVPQRPSKTNQKWGLYSQSAQNANMERMQYALQLEQGRRQYAASYARADQKMGELSLNALRAEDAHYLERQAQKNKDWEELKRERRTALFGNQVNKAYGADVIAGGEGRTSVSYGDPQSTTIKREKRVEKKRSSGTQLFNNIE